MTRRPLLILAAAALLTGCADRRLHITSDPPGAIVSLNDLEVGRTPLDVNFTSFGVYDVRLRLPGYATLDTHAEAKPELHDQPVFDALSVLVPGRPRTDVHWHFVLEPAETDPDALISRARELRTMTPEQTAQADAPIVESGEDQPDDQPGG